MEIAAVVHLEAVTKATLRHLEDRILNSQELILNLLVLRGKVAESTQDFEGIILSSLENQPSRRLGKSGNSNQDEDCKSNLESNRETPCYRAWLQERETEVDPVTDHYSEHNERALESRLVTVKLFELA